MSESKFNKNQWKNEKLWSIIEWIYRKDLNDKLEFWSQTTQQSRK